MKRMLLVVGTIVLVAITGSAGAAGDAAAGKTKAAACGGCHGANGEGNAKNPALAGKKADYLVHELQEYKSGKKNHAVMHSFASKLSDDDIENVAAYYASLKGK